ncbi:hypothetical protein ABI59_13580 [Acidobacteria bacterium Mor1]|nr:hypothetical protein ABI59_13580 [Acidobacteria bacterium Mor1]
MSEQIWTVIFAIGITQGLFLCGALFWRKSRNRAATRRLAAIVAAGTLMIGGEAVRQALPPTPSMLLVFMMINLELVFGPLMLLFAQALLDPDRKLRPVELLHFAPLALGILGWGAAWLLLGDDVRRDAALDHPVIVPLYMLFKAGWFFGYVAATYRVLRNDDRISRLHTAGRRPVELSWLRKGLLGIAALVGTIYLNDFGSRLGLDLSGDAVFGSLIIGVILYLMSLMVLQRPWILALRVRPSVDDSRLESEVARLEQYLKQEKPWRDPELSLGDLAGSLKLSENRLSELLRQGLGTSFYGLLNRLRLEEFERLAREPGRRDASVLELAFEAGFNSKAAFYRVFREAHGITPGAFRRAI